MLRMRGIWSHVVPHHVYDSLQEPPRLVALGGEGCVLALQFTGKLCTNNERRPQTVLTPPVCFCCVGAWCLSVFHLPSSFKYSHPRFLISSDSSAHEHRSFTHSRTSRLASSRSAVRVAFSCRSRLISAIALSISDTASGAIAAMMSVSFTCRPPSSGVLETARLVRFLRGAWSSSWS